MTFFYLVFGVIFCLLFSVRFLRWLGFFQQKEYRLDRLVAFITTNEGSHELTRIVPRPSDFTRTGLKRPVITGRVMFIALATCILVGLLSLAVFYSLSLNLFTIYLIIIYLLIPIVVGLASVPSSVISSVVTQHELQEAKEKIKKINPKIIGITGSYGKTSTKHLLAHLLSSKYSVFTTPSSHNTKYSVAKAINISYQGEEIVVLEYGAYTQDEIKELADWFQPTIAVITGLAPQHLELFGTIENIISAKAELIKALPSAATVYYYDQDSGAKKIVEKGTKNTDYVICSVNEHELKIVNVETDSNTGQLRMNAHGKNIKTKLVGLQYRAAISLACQIAKDLDISAEDCMNALQTFEPSDNFTRSYTLDSGALVIDDGGTSNPFGALAALNLLSEMKVEKKFFAFSGIVDLGKESRTIHSSLAQQAADIVDEVWYLGSVGMQDFTKEKINIIHEKKEIEEKLSQLDQHSALLIEGRMPGWFLNEIKQRHA